MLCHDRVLWEANERYHADKSQVCERFILGVLATDHY